MQVTQAQAGEILAVATSTTSLASVEDGERLSAALNESAAAMLAQIANADPAAIGTLSDTAKRLSEEHARCDAMLARLKAEEEEKAAALAASAAQAAERAASDMAAAASRNLKEAALARGAADDPARANWPPVRREGHPAEDTVPGGEMPGLIDEEALGLLLVLARFHGHDRPPATFLRGPAGWGKTTMPYILGRALRLPVLKVDGPAIRDKTDLWGMNVIAHDAKGRPSMEFRESRLSKVFEHGHAIVLLDEINRGRDPMGLQRAIMPMLDESATVEADGERFLRRGPGLFFFATANIGAHYVATSEIDPALASRFAFYLEVAPRDASAALLGNEGVNPDALLNAERVYPLEQDATPTHKRLALIAAARFTSAAMSANLPPYPGPPDRRSFVNFERAIESCRTVAEIGVVGRAVYTTRYPEGRHSVREQMEETWRSLTSDIRPNAEQGGAPA